MKDNKTPAVISPFKKRFLMQFKNNRKLFIAEFILQLLGIPLATLCFAKINIVLKDIQYQDDYYENYPFRTIDFYENIYIFGLGFLFLAILVGAVIALKNYSYLLKRNKTDMEMSLPLSRKQMFLADYFSGLLVYILPYLIIVVVTLPIWFISSPTEDVPSSYLLPGYRSQVYIPEPGFILMAELFIFIAMLFVYTFTVMISTCCGNAVNAVAYLILSNAAIVTAASLIKTIIGSCSLNDFYYMNVTYEAERLCPAGSLWHVIRYLEDYTELSGSVSGEINWMICTLISCTVCFITALLIFRHRKAEDTGKNFIVPLLFYIVSALITASVMWSINGPRSLYDNIRASYDKITFSSSVLAAFIIYAVMLSLKEKTVKIRKPFRKLLFFIASVTVSFLLCVVCLKTYGYGFSFYNPEAISVKSARIEFPSLALYEDYTDYSHIKKITDLNRELNSDMMLIVDNSSVEEKYFSSFPEANCYTTDNYYYYRRGYYPHNDEQIHITYILKNGYKYDRKFTPVTVDYTQSEIYKTMVDEFRKEMEPVNEEYIDLISDKDITVFCGNTSFTEELYGRRFRPFTTSADQYPAEFIVKEYDRTMLYNILSKSYDQYYDTDDCYTFQIAFYNETGNGYGYDENDIFFLPSEYSDLYEEFLNNSKTEKLIWKYTQQES